MSVRGRPRDAVHLSAYSSKSLLAAAAAVVAVAAISKRTLSMTDSILVGNSELLGSSSSRSAEIPVGTVMHGLWAYRIPQN